MVIVSQMVVARGIITKRPAIRSFFKSCLKRWSTERKISLQHQKLVILLLFQLIYMIAFAFTICNACKELLQVLTFLTKYGSHLNLS